MKKFIERSFAAAMKGVAAQSDSSIFPVVMISYRLIMKGLRSLFAVALMAVTGCMQFDQPIPMSGDEIIFGAAAFQVETKASSGTSETTSLSSFYVSAVTGSAGSEESAFTSTQFTQIPSSNPAVYNGSKFWPASDQGWKFYASNAPLTFHADGTTVAATNTTDVVCAYLTDGTYKTKNTLTFEHIFARFGRVDVVAEEGYTISDISIRITPKTGGTYNLRTGAGQTDGTGWGSVTTGSSTVVASQTGANGNDIYLVPGTYSMTATWTATNSGVSVTYTDRVVNVPAVAGKTNIYSVVLGGEIMFGVDLVEYCDYDYRDNLDYLTFYCDEAGTIGWKCSDASVSRTIQYSKDFGSTWTDLTSTTGGATVSVSAGDIVWFKGSNFSYGTIADFNTFMLTNKAYVYGNVNSLTGDNTSVGELCFYNLFSGCGSNLYTYAGKKIILPAATLANYCYSEMFFGCTSIASAPELPATTLASGCYSGMFEGCLSLTSAPERLPATTLADYCYSAMFYNCSSLTSAPELPATTLASGCYRFMFQDCSSLRTAPELPVTTLANYCYSSMFQGCISLTSAPELPATTLAINCYRNMFYGCRSLITAPELPATTLASNCYNYMFYNCSSLNYIKALFTTTPTSTYTGSWVSGVAATGTFVKSPDATWDVTGVNGVPTGWEVVRYVPIGVFSINASGDQVGFAPGNLQCTIASGPDATGYNYVATDWKFADHQWDVLGTTDAANSFTVGKKMDLLNWIGSSASYDSYGLCTSTAESSVYFGTSASDRLKTDWGDIPGVIANCGWYTLTADEWSYILFTRSTGKTINSTPDARYTLATIRTDVSAVKGMILFPDDYSGGTPTGVTWGPVNTYSNFATSCTASGWNSLETAGCVFLPISGYLWDRSIGQFTVGGFYWSSTSTAAGKAREICFKSSLVTLGNDGRPCGFCVRLVRNIG